jgi:hypothetical protein
MEQYAMEKIVEAIEKSLPDGIQPIAFASSGFVSALMWKSEEGCRFTICREDPDTGDITTTLSPSDVEDVAKLAAIAANVFHMVTVDDLSDDLGCLAHCLSKTLGFNFDEVGTPVPATKVQ